MTDLTFTNTPAPRLLTAAEVSELLRVPRSTVYELTRSRRIPFLKVVAGRSSIPTCSSSGWRSRRSRHGVRPWSTAELGNHDTTRPEVRQDFE